METLAAVKTIEDVQSILGEIHSINAGGCGIAAYSMYLWLKKNKQLPEDFNIVYLYRAWDVEEYESNEAFLEGNGDEAYACVHAIVYMNGKYIDSKGDYEIPRGISHTTIINPEHIDRFMIQSLNTPDQWNYSFNRENYIPMIEAALEIDLSKIEL